jgi:probable phosphoglycerate mutase
MTTLYLVRHGETVDNARQIMQGQTQGALNEMGIQQAKELAARFQHETIDAFVASDLKRSIDTCLILAEPHGKSVAQTPLLRERDWGSFTGRFIPDLKGEVWPDDIETLEALQNRARVFLQYIKETYPNQRVVAVGHGIINKAIQAVHFGKKMPEVERMTNCEVRQLLIE